MSPCYVSSLSFLLPHLIWSLFLLPLSYSVWVLFVWLCSGWEFLVFIVPGVSIPLRVYCGPCHSLAMVMSKTHSFFLHTFLSFSCYVVIQKIPVGYFGVLLFCGPANALLLCSTSSHTGDKTHIDLITISSSIPSGIGDFVHGV